MLNSKNFDFILRGCFAAVLTLIVTSCFVMQNKFSVIAPGTWRAVLALNPKQIVSSKDKEVHTVRQLLTDKTRTTEPEAVKMEEATEGELPFLMEVKYVNENSFGIEIINGDERIKVEPEDIKYGHDRQTGKDTLRIEFPVFGSYITAVYRERVIEGEWIIPTKKISIGFTAHYGQNQRFTTLAKTPDANLSGKWEATFDVNNPTSAYKAVGEFTQNGNILRGTFRTETGDYRYLDGEVQANKFYLSCFDGAHAFLFEGKILPDGSLVGIFRSGKSEPEVWEAKRNPNAALRDANSLTTAKSSNEAINFTFPNADGKPISLSNYGDKVKILQIFGTWCPNCFDETRFLTKYLADNPSDKLAVVALAFERNAEVAVPQITTYKKKMSVPYEIVVAGTTNKKDSASQRLPWLSKVMAFPTMVFVDKKNHIRRVHTGFDGPATSAYGQFAKDFDEFVKKLISE